MIKKAKVDDVAGVAGSPAVGTAENTRPNSGIAAGTVDNTIPNSGNPGTDAAAAPEAV